MTARAKEMSQLVAEKRPPATGSRPSRSRPRPRSQARGRDPGVRRQDRQPGHRGPERARGSRGRGLRRVRLQGRHGRHEAGGQRRGRGVPWDDRGGAATVAVQGEERKARGGIGSRSRGVGWSFAVTVAAVAQSPERSCRACGSCAFTRIPAWRARPRLQGAEQNSEPDAGNRGNGLSTLTARPRGAV